MPKLKMFLFSAAMATLASLPITAQQPTAAPGQAQPNQPGMPSQQPTPQTLPGNHSDPTAPTQSQPAGTDSGSSQGSGQDAGSGSAAVAVPHTANSPEANNSSLRPVTGELVSALDAKDAKAGDPIVLKTTESATVADGVVIPKGSKITGQIVDVKPIDDTHKNSQVTLLFSQAELKGGQTMPIKSLLQSVAAAGAADASGAMAGGAPMTGPSAGAPATGGPTGGVANGSASASSGAPGTASSQSAQPGNAGSAAPSSSAGAVASGMPAAGTVVAQQGNVQVKTTSVPGVLVETNADGQPFANASGALLGARQNVHLDSGTHVTLAIVNSNSKPSNR